MKHIYTLLLASTVALGANAQSQKPYVLATPQTQMKPIVVSSDIDFSTLGHDIMSEPNEAPAHIARKATEYAGGFTLEENQYIVGSSTSDEYWNFGSVPYEGETLVGAVLYNTAYEKLNNARAVGIRFCLPEDYDDGTGHIQKVDDVEVLRVTLHDNTIDGIIREATPRSVAKGWNYVKFKSPQALDPVGMFISYTYMQTKSPTCYGMCNWPDPAPGGFWTCLTNPSTGKLTWSNFSSQYGAVCIQLIVEADPLPDYDLEVVEVDNPPLAKGLAGDAAFYLTSNSKKDIQSFEYTITIGDNSVTRTSTLQNPIPAGVDQEVAYYLTLPAVDEYGTYSSVITINKVNGETLARPSSYTFSQDVYTRLAKRHSVVEEWTGTGCGNCPRGWYGMEYLKENLSDKCYVIAVHQYNQNDPMYCNRYGGLGLSAAPACKIDRKTQADPYYGIDNTGIHNAVNYYSKIAPAVDLSVVATFGDNKNTINCTADVEWLFDTGKCTIAYVLTADGLTGKGAWLQQNYYASKNPESAILPDMPDFADFFSGGSKGKAATELVYNDALVGSSWSTSGANQTKALGATKHKAGEKLTNSYTCSVSVGDVCKAAMDYDKLYVTAIVLNADNQIMNAARAKVTSSEGIDTVLAPTTTADDAIYNLSGQRVSTPARGLYIQGGKKVIR